MRLPTTPCTLKCRDRLVSLFSSYRCEWSAHCNDTFRNSYGISMCWQCWHFLAGWPHTYFFLLTYCFNILPWLESNKKKVITVSEETNGDESVTEAHKAWEVSARRQDWKIKVCFVVETFSKSQISQCSISSSTMFWTGHELNIPQHLKIRALKATCEHYFNCAFVLEPTLKICYGSEQFLYISIMISECT